MIITKFEAVFERNNIRRDGVAMLEFRVPTVDLAKVLESLVAIGGKVKVVATVIERKDVVFELKDAAFEKLDIYREGDSRIRFTTMANDLMGLNKVSEFIEMNLNVEVYRLE